MDRDGYLHALRRDSTALVDAARAADADAEIEACPGWRPVDLAWHIAEAHHFWGVVVIDHLTEYPSDAEALARPATAEGVFDAATTSAKRLIDALYATDPATPVWTWSDDRSVGFVLRRMAQETAVHRVDAERAAGNDHQVDPELASDGIDEFVSRFLVREVDGAPLVDGSVHLHCTDVAGEWVVAPGADGSFDVTREHAKGDAAIRGDAHDLLMVLWRRAPLSSVDVVGDATVAERFVTRTELE